MRFKYLPPGEWRILDLLYFWHVFWTSCFLNLILFWIDCISLFVRNEYWLIWEGFAWYNLDSLNIVARNMVTEISETNDKNLTNIPKLHFIIHCWHLNMIILTLTHMTFVDYMILEVFKRFKLERGFSSNLKIKINNNDDILCTNENNCW